MIDPTELLDIVNEKDEVTQVLPRKQAHSEMLLHRTTHIWVINSQGQILCQQRSHLKDRWAGMWECWFGGHLQSGTNYLETTVIETNEELGLQVKPEEFAFFDKRRGETSEENIFFSIYALQRDLDIKSINYEVEEVESLEWLDIGELVRIYSSDDNKWVRYGYELDMLSWLKSKF